MAKARVSTWQRRHSIQLHAPDLPQRWVVSSPSGCSFSARRHPAPRACALELVRVAAAHVLAAAATLHAVLDGQGAPLLKGRLPVLVRRVLPPAGTPWEGAPRG